ncbi:MAG: thiol reductant ABC exporter subunit CydD, partial [Anaerobacillus sp.]
GVSMAATVKQKVREALLQKFSGNPMLTSYQGQSGQKVSILLDAVDEIDSYYSKYIPQVIQTAIIPFFILVAVSTQHLATGGIMIITAPFIPIFYIIIGIRTQKKSDEQLEQMTIFSGRFLDTIQGLTTLKLFHQAKKYKEVIKESSLSYRDATLEVLKVAFVSSLMLELISMLSIGIIALEIGLRLIVFNTMSFTTAFFILMLTPEFYLSLKDLGSAFHTGRGSMSAMNKVSEELDLKTPKGQWGELPLELDENPPAIDLRDISFKYQESHFSLKPLSTTIDPYQKVAVVGKSGSGKSTFLHLIGGLLPPDHGKMVVNDIPLARYKEASWFEHVSYISQSPYLFTGSIAENISIGTRRASREEIEEAAEKAGISTFITSLKEGYDTWIGEGGRGLSGGEKQRIALARAFLNHPKIVLFDEPTTGLDLYTEKVLQSSIEELSKVATVITVAHRLHTIRKADKILVLEEGELVAEGTDENLFFESPLYRQMVSVQNEEVMV